MLTYNKPNITTKTADNYMQQGDLNQDGIVDAIDLSIFVSRWGSNDPDADLNNDGIVDAADLSILVSNWGETSSGDPTPLAIAGASASSSDGDNVPDNTYDDSFDTRWSGAGFGVWCQWDLGSEVSVGRIDIAWFNGDERAFYFDIQVSVDGDSWTTVYAGGISSGATNEFEEFNFVDSAARYVRYVGYGNTSSSSSLAQWNSITQVRIYPETGTGSIGNSPTIDNFAVSAGDNLVDAQWWATPGSLVEVQRSLSESGPFQAIATTQAGEYQDTTAENDTTYWYRAEATNAAGSTLSGMLSATPTESPDPSASWQQAWDTQDYNTILAWYEANAGLSNPSALGQPSNSHVASTHNGQVIENLNIDYTGTNNRGLTIQHDDVTVRNCKIKTDGPKNGIWVEAGSTGVVIEHCEIDGGYPSYDTGGPDPNRPANWGNVGIVARSPGIDFIRNNLLYGVRQGAALYQFTTVEYNFVYNLHINGPSVSTSSFGHLGSSLGYAGGTLIRKNMAESGSSGGITVYSQSGGPAQEAQFLDNLVVGVGRGFGIRGGHSGDNRADMRDIVINDNRFHGTFGFPSALGEGTNAAVNISKPGCTFDRNRWLGSSVDLPARCGTQQNACE